MKIKLSKSQWESVGKENGWLKTASSEKYRAAFDAFVDSMQKECEQNPERAQFASSYIIGSLRGLVPEVLADIEHAVTTGLPPLGKNYSKLNADSIIEAILKKRNPDADL